MFHPRPGGRLIGSAGRWRWETTFRNVFASGDVRSGSVKRVGAAIGEGAVVGAELHAALSNGAAVPARRDKVKQEAQRHQTRATKNVGLTSAEGCGGL